MASVFSDKSDQTRMERTLVSMEEIRSAILGTTSERVRGDVRFSGYVQDMGDLPELVQGQPKGLWKIDLDGDGKEDLPGREAYSPCDVCCLGKADGGKVQAVFLGWNGPYLKQPAGDVLKDGWSNSFVFERDRKDLIIKSLGADGKTGGEGPEGDIVLTIAENDWLAPVAGYISPYITFRSKDDVEAMNDDFLRKGKTPWIVGQDELEVMAYIYYGPRPGYQPEVRNVGAGKQKATNVPVWDVTHGTYKKCVETNEDGYFCFDRDKKVPIGNERILAIAQPMEGPNVLHPYKIQVEPGINWLGNMGTF